MKIQNTIQFKIIQPKKHKISKREIKNLLFIFLLTIIILSSYMGVVVIQHSRYEKLGSCELTLEARDFFESLDYKTVQVVGKVPNENSLFYWIGIKENEKTYHFNCVNLCFFNPNERFVNINERTWLKE